MLFALGYMANRGNQEALGYLLESLKPGVWQNRKVIWQLSYSNLRERDIHLTKLAILALGVSGRQEAIPRLSAITDPLYRGVAKTAIEANEKVRALGGLKNYYASLP